MACYRDNYSGSKISQGFDAVGTVDANSGSVDTRDYESLMIAAIVGASGDTLSGSVKFELQVEESDDNTNFTDVADADLLHFVTGASTGTFAVVDDPAEDGLIYTTGYRGHKRYVRVRLEFTGTHTNGIPISVVYIQGHPRLSPVNVA